MNKCNTRILLDVRDTMKHMLTLAESDSWDKVTLLDKERTGLLAELSVTEYTGELELIDEIVKLDKKIIESAEKARSELNDKVARVSHTREIHNEYQTIADL